MENVSRFICEYVPGAQVREIFGQEVVYDLSQEHASAYGELLKALEQSDNSAGVESYGIEGPSLEDVFFK